MYLSTVAGRTAVLLIKCIAARSLHDPLPARHGAPSETLGLAFPSTSVGAGTTSNQSSLAPLHEAPEQPFVPGEYIVVLHANSTFSDHVLTLGSNLSDTGNALQVFHALPGYHARFDNNEQLERVRGDPHVCFVEQNSVMDISISNDTETEWAESSTLHRRSWLSSVNVNGDPSYALPMLSTLPRQKLNTPVPNGDANQFVTYFGQGGLTPGQGVDVYILDTGMNINHPTFEGRASNFQNTATTPFCPGESWDDVGQKGSTHGTAVASCVGGANKGTAQSSNLINVRVLCTNRDNTNAGILAGLNAVTLQHNIKRTQATNFKASVINMSFGANFGYFAQDVMLQQAKAAGITLVAAAGNDDIDDPRWPCAYDSVICVGAVDNNYQRWSEPGANPPAGSQFGRAVNIFAPGAGIIVADPNVNLDRVRSSTSFAAPFVSGILAGYLSWDKTLGTNSEAILFQNAQLGLLNFVNPPTTNTVNALANNGAQLDISRVLPFLGANGPDPVQKRSAGGARGNRLRRQQDGNQGTTTTSYTFASAASTAASQVESFPDFDIESTTLTLTEASTTEVFTLDPTVTEPETATKSTLYASLTTATSTTTTTQNALSSLQSEFSADASELGDTTTPPPAQSSVGPALSSVESEFTAVCSELGHC